MIKISKNNDIIKEIKGLQKNNKNQDLVYVDDLSTLKLTMSYPIKVKTFIYCDELTYHDETKELISFLSDNAESSYSISKATFESIRQKDNSAGLIAVLYTNLKSLDELKGLDYLVVCDSLEIPGNIGTIYRTMDSAKVGGMILVDSVTKPNNSKLAASARGCNFLIPTVSTTYEQAQEWLLNNGYDIFLGEPNLGLSYKEYDYQGKIAIVVGSERFGINAKWYDNKHKKVFIPMYGSNNSLNVGVAASILIYEATSKRIK